MAKEQYFQKKIIKWFHSIGGTAITGQLPIGEADVQAGYPHHGRLLNVMVEVKTEEAYNKLMKGLHEVDGLYTIVDKAKLKEHEALQILKINIVREKGGMALVAFSVDQVKDYIAQELLKC